MENTCFEWNFNAMAAAAAALRYVCMAAATALDTKFCHLIGSISIFNLLFFHNFHIILHFNFGKYGRK
jgi:hypothetical protein